MFKLGTLARVNRWTLYCVVNPEAPYRKRKWDCECECGKRKHVLEHNLRYGLTLGCGCQRGLKRKNEQACGLRTIRTIYSVRAVKKDISFNIPKLKFEELVMKDCFYCGATPHEAMYGRIRVDKTRAKVTYNGLDRVDNSRGYEVDNVVPCCRICNIMKAELSVQEFYVHIQKILDRRSHHGIQTV
jgi:hypothetical protein